MQAGDRHWADAFALLERGEFAAARAAFEAMLLETETAAAHENLCRLGMALEDIAAAKRHGERAYRMYRESGDARRAAGAAVMMAQAYMYTGNEMTVQGWLGTAGRLLEEVGPCPELGYYRLAWVGCEVRDADQLERSAADALGLARQFGDTDLEIRAVADSGLALVRKGQVAAGMARLDQAMSSIVAGDVRNYMIAGQSCCAMLHACLHIGDVERATQWSDAVMEHARSRFGSPPPAVLQSHCRLVYGTLLCGLGRGAEAEAELRRAFDSTGYIGRRAEIVSQLADLRIQEGRLADATEILRGWEDRLEVAGSLARLHFARDEIDLAAATARRALAAREDVLYTPPLFDLQVQIEIRRGDLAAAAAAAARLRAAAEALQVPSLMALAHLNAGRVAGAGGADPIPSLLAGLALLQEGEWPAVRAELHAELARALKPTEPTAAITEARAALALFERIGARRAANQAAALLRSLGVTARTPGGVRANLDSLSRREHEVLTLLAEGLSNAEIAKRLFITPKTAEHHVSSILSKLDLRSRAEAAAYRAAAARPAR
jgi:DNA-binding CsgD family transcriptional regulator/tetratricopeptide (TPR) repeat protein